MTFLVILIIALIFIFFAIVTSSGTNSNKTALNKPAPNKTQPIKLPERKITSSPKNNDVSVPLKDIDKLIKAASLTESAREKYFDAILNDQSYVLLTNKEYNESMARETLQRLRDTEWGTLYSFKKEAQGLERAGNLTAAFESYSKLLRFVASSKTLTTNNYSHDVNRLRIVSNKLKRKSEFETLLLSLGIDYPKNK